MAVLEREHFGGEFGAAVEGDWRLRREVLDDAARRDAGRKRFPERESIPQTPHRQRGEWWDGIDTAGAEQGEAGAMRFAVFEQVDGAAEIVFEDLARAAAAIDAGEDAGHGGGVEEPVGGGEGVDVGGAARVEMLHGDAAAFQGEAV